MLKKFKNGFLKIHLVDRCLIIFMTVLLLQISYNMFVNTTSDEKSNGIDIVVRTSAAGIFGYFLSGNFVKQENGIVKRKMSTENSTDITAQEKIYTVDSLAVSVFSSSTENPIKAKGVTQESLPQEYPPQESLPQEYPPQESLPQEYPPQESLSQEYPPQESNNLQIIIATAIGLYCVVVLLIARNVSMIIPDYKYTQDTLATISQFRDFISGCVGFLIGTPTTKN